MKLLISVFVIVFCFSHEALSQSSQVILSSFKVMDVMEPSSGELNNFMIEVSASDPLALSRLEIILQEGTMSINTTSVYFQVATKEGKAELVFEKYSVPFNGKSIQFGLKVRDQFKSPYHKIFIKGYDKTNQETNQLEYTRIN